MRKKLTPIVEMWGTVGKSKKLYKATYMIVSAEPVTAEDHRIDKVLREINAN